MVTIDDVKPYIENGQLYQLGLGNRVVGEVVRIDGPWDTYGYVVKYDDLTNVSLIRGIGKNKQIGVLLKGK